MAQAQAVALHDLIEILKDSEQGFAAAAEVASRPDLKKFFRDLSYERAGFASALQEMVEDGGESPEAPGTVSGAIRRGWMTITSAFSKGDVTVLEECERGEVSAIGRFGETLAGYLPTGARQLVERQYEQVQTARDRIGKLRDVAHMSATAR